jgi:hypothetical protein
LEVYQTDNTDSQRRWDYRYDGEPFLRVVDLKVLLILFGVIEDVLQWEARSGGIEFIGRSVNELASRFEDLINELVQLRRAKDILRSSSRFASYTGVLSNKPMHKRE